MDFDEEDLGGKEAGGFGFAAEAFGDRVDDGIGGEGGAAHRVDFRSSGAAEGEAVEGLPEGRVLNDFGDVVDGVLGGEEFGADDTTGGIEADEDVAGAGVAVDGVGFRGGVEDQSDLEILGIENCLEVVGRGARTEFGGGGEEGEDLLGFQGGGALGPKPLVLVMDEPDDGDDHPQAVESREDAA